MSLESELSKLRHPSNSKNFPILGTVPFESPHDNSSFPMAKFLANDLGEYADDAIANEIPEYYPRVAEILFSDKTFEQKMRNLEKFQYYMNLPAHEYEYFRKVASALSDQKIAEARTGAVDEPKLPSSTVNNATKTGIYTPCAGGNLGIWGTLVTKVFKRSQKRGPFIS